MRDPGGPQTSAQTAQFLRRASQRGSAQHGSGRRGSGGRGSGRATSQDGGPRVAGRGGSRYGAPRFAGGGAVAVLAGSAAWGSTGTAAHFAPAGASSVSIGA